MQPTQPPCVVPNYSSTKSLAGHTLGEVRRAEILETIHDAKEWQIQGDLRYGAILKDDYDHPDKLVTRAEFTAIEPKLADLLDHISSQPGHCFSGNMIRASLSLWSSPHIVFPPAAHHIPRTHEDIVVSDMTELTAIMVDDDIRFMRLKCFEYILYSTDKGLRYARMEQERVLDISTNTMDEKWPGWRERYQIAKALDLQADLLAAHVLPVEAPCSLVVSQQPSGNVVDLIQDIPCTS